MIICRTIKTTLPHVKTHYIFIKMCQDGFHRPVTAAFVVCFGITESDCASRRQLTLIKEINQFAIYNVSLIAVSKAHRCLLFWLLGSL